MQKLKQISDFIKCYEILSKEHCELLIKQSETYKWQKHQWGAYDTKVESEREDTEFDRAAINSIGHLILNQYITKSIDNYIKEFSANGHSFNYNGYTVPNMNRYTANTQMLQHCDHIYSCFDGSIKGIPILSIVGLLNNDFSGGEFVFWDDTKFQMKTGDILVFPSNFMYPHHVNLVNSGTRYSFVSWVY